MTIVKNPKGILTKEPATKMQSFEQFNEAFRNLLEVILSDKYNPIANPTNTEPIPLELHNSLFACCLTNLYDINKFGIMPYDNTQATAGVYENGSIALFGDGVVRRYNGAGDSTNVANWEKIIFSVNEIKSITNNSIVGDVKQSILNRSNCEINGWYVMDGRLYDISSPQGTVLRSFPLPIKSQWRIVEQNGKINLPNLLEINENSRGMILRPVNNDDLLGSMQVGEIKKHTHVQDPHAHGSNYSVRLTGKTRFGRNGDGNTGKKLFGSDGDVSTGVGYDQVFSVTGTSATSTPSIKETGGSYNTVTNVGIYNLIYLGV